MISALFSELMALGASTPSSTIPHGQVVTLPVDPMTVDDDDFARHRDPLEWKGFKVSRDEFTEWGVKWRLWKIEAAQRREGPLWVVPHDNENAAFEASLVAVRSYGGTVVAVDSGTVAGFDGNRRNWAVTYGAPIDPNRNFRDWFPVYAGAVLESKSKGWPIIALHSNAAGSSPAELSCSAPLHEIGNGDISGDRCPAYILSKSRARAWPFYDEDTAVLIPFFARYGRQSAFCGEALMADDFNLIFERVVRSDGSLSNYALYHGLTYLNFETRNLGATPAALAAGRDRLLNMIVRAMKLCKLLPR
jgi:hypothetical protein